MKFSVIIPLYNKAPYVAKAIYSVIEQTYINWELIVIDDGSQDDSLKVVEELRRTDLLDVEKQGRFRLVLQTNVGVATTRNRGVGLAMGDYVCFLDADDWWAPAFLQQMKDLIEEFPTAGIYGHAYWYHKNGKDRPIFIGPTDVPYRGTINYCKIYSQRNYMPLTSISVAMSKEIFDKLGGFNPNLSLGEDFDLWIRIALRYPVVVNNTPLAYYNQDVDVNNRAIGRLHDPAKHMLWNLDYLEEEERKNVDYKRLIDMLRVYGLFPYYLSKQYHSKAKEQLAKVDWMMQPLSIRIKYSLPVFALRIYMDFCKLLSELKQLCIKWHIF